MDAFIIRVRTCYGACTDIGKGTKMGIQDLVYLGNVRYRGIALYQKKKTSYTIILRCIM